MSQQRTPPNESPRERPAERTSRRYRILLRAFPRPFRERFGADMEAMFVDRLRDAPHAVARLAIWTRGIADVLVHAASERRAIRHRDAHAAGTGFVGIGRDVRFAARVLFRDRTFTVTALLTLVLCLGGNAAIFSIVRSVLLRPLPIAESDRIVLLSNVYPKAGFAHAGPGVVATGVPDYIDRQREIRVLPEQALYQRTNMTLGLADGAQRVSALGITPSFFRLLRARPEIGRLFVDDDGQEGNEMKAILSYRFWQRQYGGDRAIVGGDVRLNGRPYHVVGITPPDFEYLWNDIDLWLPLAFTVEQRADESRHSNNWVMIARLATGATVDQAQREIDALNARNAVRFPQFASILRDAGFRTEVVRLQDEVVRDVRPTLYLLWGGVLLVLLVGGVNLANLILVRASGRWRELATRHALGAGSVRLARQMLTETTLLTIAGGVLGIGAGWWILRSLGALHLELLPRGHEIQLDWQTAVVMIGLATTVGLATGMIPVAQLSQANLGAILREAGRSGTLGASAGTLRRVLAMAQVAFAFVLLIGAGLLLASFRAVSRIDPGFQPAGVVTAKVNLPRSRYGDDAATAAAITRMLVGVRAVPGVTAAGVTSTIPLGGDYDTNVILAEGHAMQPGESLVAPHSIMVSDGYFEAMRIPLASGRSFDARETPTSPPAIIIDERLARRFWPNGDAVGHRMYQPQSSRDVLAVGPNTRYLTVIGVVKNVQLTGLAPRDPLIGTFYYVHTQAPVRALTFAVRSSQPASAIVSGLRQSVLAIDRELPVFDVETMNERLDESLVGRRVPMLIALAFGLVALFLAAVGIYGVLAHQVAQRRREIGIRVALGSSTRQIIGLVVGDGARITAVGLLVGLVGTFAVAKLMSGLLYGVRPTDPWVIVLVAIVLTIVAFVATLIPARRAARVDPIRALSE